MAMAGPSFTLNPIDNTMPEQVPEPSSSSSQVLLSRAHLSCDNRSRLKHHHIEQLPEEHMESPRTAGIKVRDFACELMPSSGKATEVFDP